MQLAAHRSDVTQGERLRSARLAKGISSQKALAKLADVDPSVVSRCEADKVTTSLDNLMKLARVLGVSVEWLADGEGDGSAAPTTRTTQESGEARIELDDDPMVYDELLAKFIRDFANDFPPEVIATMRTGVFGADGQRPSSLMGYVKLAQQLEKALAGEVRIVFEPVKK